MGDAACSPIIQTFQGEPTQAQVLSSGCGADALCYELALCMTDHICTEPPSGRYAGRGCRLLPSRALGVSRTL